MSPYLSPTKSEKRAREIPLLVFYCLMVCACVSTTLDALKVAMDTTLLVNFALLCLFTWAALRIVRMRIARSNAVHIADQLALLTEDRIPFSKLESILPKSLPKITSLIKQGYLQNVYIDRNQRVLHLTVANAKVKKGAYVKAACPSCGAKQLIQRGRVSICEYCGQTMLEK